ncbi:intestinal mucin-like protein [Ambystoma mexicanum]|uniref:intestinal mucin-like protein n=1 Tax=Ambystoma mexicanum TaxID=8296 RepID=UPI0037E7D463
MLPMKCCGTCVQVACILHTQYNTSQIIKPGDLWFPDTMECSYFSCSSIKGKMVLSKVQKTCKILAGRSCKTTTELLQCCEDCRNFECELKNRKLEIKGEHPDTSMDLMYCSIKGSEEPPAMGKTNLQCKCCEPTQTSTKMVSITLSNGENINVPYATAEKCGCKSCQEE